MEGQLEILGDVMQAIKCNRSAAIRFCINFTGLTIGSKMTELSKDDFIALMAKAYSYLLEEKTT